MSTKVQLSGGAFQDSLGQPLANGYLLFELSQDARVNGNTEICAGHTLRIQLDNSGDIVTSPPQSVWPNDAMTPTNTFYMVSGYTASGQLVWGPNAQQVQGSPSPFDVGAWIPTRVNTLAIPVTTYDVGLFIPGSPLGGQTVLYLQMERTIRFASNLAPSTAKGRVSASSDAVFSVTRNGTQFATITFHSDGTSTLLSTVGAILFAGDILSVTAPATPDATLADIGFIFSATVVL